MVRVWNNLLITKSKCDSAKIAICSQNNHLLPLSMFNQDSTAKKLLHSGIGLLILISGCVGGAIQSESSFARSTASSNIAIAKSSVNNLKETEQPILVSDASENPVTLTGEKGEYTAQVEVTGSLEKAWEVLTDYDNFEDFVPNTVNSEILEENGNSLVFQQVNSVDLVLLTKEFSVKIAAVKTPIEKIQFEMLEGDLGSLTGSWEVESVSDNRILLTHKVSVTPKSQSEAAIFYPIYEGSLEDTIAAIASEITKRSQAN